ncbi:Tor complex Tor2 interacting protein 1 [Cymbomonas tetramitiformis]|uniref:Tor complex Tor2 interacting protein 1 n=1 Tax=Cymbomonas tetramitiformis TaxID=36881 RepID=A0AAE0F2P2_9CHLO|nr:Tor complex Tor2 interacting protein 1 [Cymbomonas tetramitiformis]
MNDEQLRNKVQLLLQNAQYKVTSECRRKTAFKLLCASSKQDSPRFDLVLLDHEPPQVRGDKFLSALQRSVTHRRPPVIMISSQNEPRLLAKCLLMGAVDYLVLPVRANELRHLWTHVWRQKHKERLPPHNVAHLATPCSRVSVSSSEEEGASEDGSADESAVKKRKTLSGPEYIHAVHVDTERSGGAEQMKTAVYAEQATTSDRVETFPSCNPASRQRARQWDASNFNASSEALSPCTGPPPLYRPHIRASHLPSTSDYHTTVGCHQSPVVLQRQMPATSTSLSYVGLPCSSHTSDTTQRLKQGEGINAVALPGVVAEQHPPGASAHVASGFPSHNSSSATSSLSHVVPSWPPLPSCQTAAPQAPDLRGSKSTDGSEASTVAATVSNNGKLPPAEKDATMGSDLTQTRTRQAAFQRYKEKKNHRVCPGMIRYKSRKELADQRPRVKGQFVKQKPDSSLAMDSAKKAMTEKLQVWMPRLLKIFSSSNSAPLVHEPSTNFVEGS